MEIKIKPGKVKSIVNKINYPYSFTVPTDGHSGVLWLTRGP